jgi:hypothetical protein
MVGSVPPSSMHSMSSSVKAARRASSATDRPRAVRSALALPEDLDPDSDEVYSPDVTSLTAPRAR